MKDMIWGELGFFVKCLNDLAVSESMRLTETGSYCVSTGTYSENWVYFPEDITNHEAVNVAVNFFREREEEFMWPVYSGGGKLLENAGLIYAGDLAAMSLEPDRVRIVDDRQDVKIYRSDDYEEWAIISWLGFGGSDEDFPENYCDFVKALSEQRERVSLYSAKYEGENAGVFLLTNEAEMRGVYYFAVVPEFRRRGIARAMMNEICRLSEGKRIVLQSTPMGEKFYRSYGFGELFRMRVYSTEEDIF